LFKIRKFVPTGVFRLLYLRFMRCRFQYFLISWGTANESVLQQLLALQNNILRIITCSKYRTI